MMKRLKLILILFCCGLIFFSLSVNQTEIIYGHPSWSKKESILFESNKDGGVLFKLYQVSLSDTNMKATEITSEILGDTDGEWLYSDNETVICVGEREINNQDIFKISKSKVEQLTNDPKNEYSPSSSKAGDIVYLNDSKIYIMNANGKNVRQIKGVSGNAIDPVWLSNTTLLFSNKINGRYELCKIDTSGLNFNTIKTFKADNRQPAVSPDGRICFVSNKDGKNHIYVLKNSKDSVALQITFNGSENINPAWSPDGKEIVFASNRDNKWGIWIISAEPKEKETLPRKVIIK